MDPVVILATSTVSAGPGGEASVQARVRNQGRRVESYVVEVVGEPSRFCQVEPRNVSVLPGKEADITITFRPPVGASTPTGSLPFAVRAVSEVGTSSSAVAEGLLELTGAAGLQAWADPTTDAGRWSGRYALQFSNQGNAPARLFVAAHDPAGALRVTVRDEILAVPPGSQVDTEVRVKARQPFLRGSTVNRVLTASCQSFAFGAERPSPGQVAPPDDPNHRSFQLTFQQKPIVSKLTLALVALVIAAGVAFALLRLRGGDELVLGVAPPVAPLAFGIESADSTTMSLSWSAVPNAAGYDVRRTTPAGEPSGPAVGHVDAPTVRFVVEGLLPSQESCFAVESTGPEGVDNSSPSPFACATTAAPPTVVPPTDLTATPVGAATFDLAWQHPATPGTTFTIFFDSEPLKEDIDGLSNTVDLPQREATYEAELAVKAVDAVTGQASDFSNRQTVTVAAASGSAATTVPTSGPAGGPAGSPGGAPTTSPGAGVTTTVAGGGTTTTAPGATTTTVPTPAQGAIQDLDETWAAVLDPALSQPVGPTEEQRRAQLATAFGVTPEQIQTFTNRDTDARNASGPVDLVEARPPDTTFYFVPQLDETSATTFCRGDPRCRPVILRGAADAAEGTDIVVLRRLAPTTLLPELDELLVTLRTDLGRPQINVLDGADRRQFNTTELLVFASGFPDRQAADDFCAANAAVDPCDPIILDPAR